MFVRVAFAQPSSVKRQLQLSEQLRHLENGKKLLYISFLPGQENTRLLTAATRRYHCNTAVFWMTRGEGMRNYNGPEKGIDLGVIHVAEMEAAANAAGYLPFVSSCKDLGARDTATINATLPTDRLILDLTAVIRQFRPDMMIIGHRSDTVQSGKGFNHWIDSICQTACQLAAANTKLEDTALEAYSVHELLADNTPSGSLDASAALAYPLSMPIIVDGEDSISGRSFQQLSLDSKLAFRSIYPDLDSIPLKGDTAWLSWLNATEGGSDPAAITRFFSDLAADAEFGVWSRLEAAGVDVRTVQMQLRKIPALLQMHDYRSVAMALRGISELLMRGNAEHNNEKMPINPDRLWVLSQLQVMRKTIVDMHFLATSDKELGVLGQEFRLKITARQGTGIQIPVSVLGIRIPGLVDSPVIPTAKREMAAVLLDTALHIPLMQEAYQPFWLNKSMRSDGSYNIDTKMQGRLSDTTSYHVEALVSNGTDTLTYRFPVFYRHFDRMEGLIQRPFYTIEPVLLALTPTVLLTHVLRGKYPTRQKELHINMKTLFKDTAQVVLFKIRQVGIQAMVNGQKVQSDTASMVYQDAGYITPEPGARTKIGWVLNSSVIDHLNPLTPILKPTVLLKLPEGVQAFSSNIKSVGYPYQSPRIYNYHSQTMVVRDTIQTRGGRLLYLNGLSGDVFENAFNQLGYEVQDAGFKDFTSWIDEVDLNSGTVSSLVNDSLQKLDAIVISGADEALPTDSIQLQRLRYILHAYVKSGGRLINLNAAPALQKQLPLSDSVRSQMLIAGGNSERIQVDSLSASFNIPNKVPAAFFRKWEGILSRGSLPVRNTSISYPLRVAAREQNKKAFLAPLCIQYPDNGVLVNCFMELAPALSNGKAAAYKFLANILACAAPKTK